MTKISVQVLFQWNDVVVTFRATPKLEKREKLHMSKVKIYSPSSAVENVCLLDIGPVPTEVVADIHTK